MLHQGVLSTGYAVQVRAWSCLWAKPMCHCLGGLDPQPNCQVRLIQRAANGRKARPSFKAPHAVESLENRMAQLTAANLAWPTCCGQLATGQFAVGKCAAGQFKLLNIFNVCHSCFPLSFLLHPSFPDSVSPCLRYYVLWSHGEVSCGELAMG